MPTRRPRKSSRSSRAWRRGCAARPAPARKASRCGAVLQARGLSDRHALDLLEAFRRDVTKLRYADWAELMDYCRYSATPVGRFVLDVHGESLDTLAGQRRALRRAAGDQSSAGLRQGLPRARPGLHPARRTRRQRNGRRRAGGSARPRRPCAGRSRTWPGARKRCSSSRGPSPATSPTAGWRWRSASSRPWRRASRRA